MGKEIVPPATKKQRQRGKEEVATDEHGWALIAAFSSTKPLSGEKILEG